MKKSFGLAVASLVTLAALAVPSGAAQAGAEGYPSRPVTLVVGYPPGGVTDTLARILGPELEKKLGQPIVIDNKPGASGTIAAAAITRAKNDGYTYFLASAGDSTISPVIRKGQLSYDPLRDFELVHMLTEVPTILIVNKNLGVTNVDELVSLAKSKPGKLNYASYGLGTSSNLNAELFKIETGTSIEHISYKGSAPAITALRAGDVQMMFDTLSSAYPHIQSGDVKVLASASEKRLTRIPDTPTLAEAGLSGKRISGWMGIVAPKGTDPAIVAKVSKSIDEILSTAFMQKTIDDIGLIPMNKGKGEFREFLSSEIGRVQAVVDGAGIVLN
jgi:tripartite-type tricarboxylate transporter receptor subunit TctC